jgi:hypothetical protein
MRTLIIALGLLAFTTPALAKSAKHKKAKPAKHASRAKSKHKRHAALDRQLMQPSWL